MPVSKDHPSSTAAGSTGSVPALPGDVLPSDSVVTAVRAWLTPQGWAEAEAARRTAAAAVAPARERGLAALAEAQADAVASWASAWLRAERAGLARETQAVLLAEHERLEGLLGAYVARLHAELTPAFAALDVLREQKAPAALVQSHEHALAMRLHHAHAFVGDVRDGFLALLRTAG